MDKPSRPARVVDTYWLNDGKPTTLGSIPIKGEQRLETKRSEGAHIVSNDINAFLTHLRGCMCVASRAVKEQPIEEIHRQWMVLFSEYDNLRWELDAFEQSLEIALGEFVYTPLGVKTLEEAETILKKQAKESNQASREFRKQRMEWIQDQHLEEVFWLLWRAEPRPAFMPPADKVPSEADIAKAKEHISYFLDDVEYEKIIRASRGVTALKANLDALGKISTPEVVRGKVVATSKPLTEQ